MQRVQKRFDDLAVMANEIRGSFKDVRRREAENVQPLFGGPTNFKTVTHGVLDFEAMIQWQTSVVNLIARVFGADSTTFEQFSSAMKHTNYDDFQDKFRALNAIFRSAKDDFEGGYLFDVRNLIHAEMFDDELEQASYFLNEGYKTPAAVIAGTVLESCLRKLCEENKLEGYGKTINPMSDALGKVGVINKLQKKNITAWADTRNSAAHGNPEGFNDGDVKLMIEGIRQFVGSKLS